MKPQDALLIALCLALAAAAYILVFVSSEHYLETPKDRDTNHKEHGGYYEHNGSDQFTQ